MLDTLYPLKMTPLLGYWDDRPRTRNARHSNAQCNNIFISKSPTFSLRTQILPLAAIRLAAHRKYTVRQIRQKTPVAPLCEWKNLRAERLNCTELYLLIFTFEKNGTMTRGSSKPLNIFHVLYIGDRSDQNVVFVCPDSRLLRRNTRTSRRKNTTWNRY